MLGVSVVNRDSVNPSIHPSVSSPKCSLPSKAVKECRPIHPSSHYPPPSFRPSIHPRTQAKPSQTHGSITRPRVPKANPNQTKPMLCSFAQIKCCEAKCIWYRGVLAAREERTQPKDQNPRTLRKMIREEKRRKNECRPRELAVVDAKVCVMMRVYYK